MDLPKPAEPYLEAEVIMQNLLMVESYKRKVGRYAHHLLAGAILACTSKQCTMPWAPCLSHVAMTFKLCMFTLQGNHGGCRDL